MDETFAAATVGALLTVAGITPDQDELDTLVGTYPALRGHLDSLYDVEGLADIGPAVTFSMVAHHPGEDVR